MNSDRRTSQTGDGTGAGVGRALVALSFLTPLVTSAAPKLTWLFLAAVALILIAGTWRSIDWRQEARRNMAFIAVLLLALYILISTAWAIDREGALAKAALLCGIAVLALGACASAAAWDREWLRRASVAFAVGALLGALFVLSEFVTSGTVLRWWKSSGFEETGTATGSAQPMGFEKGMLRTHVQMIVIYFWPALLALSLVPGKPRRVGLLALYMAAAIIPVFISERQSSQVALVASIVFFAFAWLWREAAPRALAIAWCLGFVLALPIAFAAYDSGGNAAEWLPYSARARVFIWQHTAERVLEAPWLGIGAGSTEAVEHKTNDAQPQPSVAQPDGQVYPSGTGPHAHDVFLQVWYELGLIGVLLAAFLGAALALRVSLLPVRAQPFASAAFAAFAVSITFAWSIWQVWLLCAAGLLLLYLSVGAYAPEGPKAR